MSKINIKRLSGISVIDLLMVVSIMCIITSGMLIFYQYMTDKRTNQSLLNIAKLADHLTYSKSNQDTVILYYNEILPFQKSLFDKIDCSVHSCDAFNLKEYNKSTYLKLFYNNSNFVSFSIYSKANESIFEFNRTPYYHWLNQKDKFFANETYVDFLNKQIENATLDINKKEPYITYLSSFFKGINIYAESDTGEHLTSYDCPSESCSLVLNYTVNLESPTVSKPN